MSHRGITQRMNEQLSSYKYQIDWTMKLVCGGVSKFGLQLAKNLLGVAWRLCPVSTSESIAVIMETDEREVAA